MFHNYRTLANLFAFQFLYQLKALFIVYPFDENKRLEDGTNKSNQRWEQCTFYLFFIFNPALHALYAKTYHNEAVNWSMNNLLKEVIGDFIPVVNKLNISNDAKQDVVDKLITARYINGYPEEFLDLQKIDKFYEDLELNGTEEIIESYLKMRKYQFKINTSPSSYWKRMMDEFRKSEIVYFTKGNVICEFICKFNR